MTTICPNCKREQLETHISQFKAYTGLVWSVSQRCHACDYAIEMDDKGFIEEPWRSALTQMEGVWCLRIKKADLTVKVIKSLRENVNIFMQQLQQVRAEDMPIVFTGTKFEVNFLAGIVSELGIEIFIEIHRTQA